MLKLFSQRLKALRKKAFQGIPGLQSKLRRQQDQISLQISQINLHLHQQLTYESVCFIMTLPTKCAIIYYFFAILWVRKDMVSINLHFSNYKCELIFICKRTFFVCMDCLCMSSPHFSVMLLVFCPLTLNNSYILGILTHVCVIYCVPQFISYLLILLMMFFVVQTLNLHIWKLNKILLPMHLSQSQKDFPY